MATTRHKLYEQIVRIATGSDQAMASSFERMEVMEAMGQVINKLLKTEAYTAMGDGDVPPNGFVIATYDNVAITQYKTNFSQLILPATPIRLPRNMGVFHIGPVDDPFTSWIPVPSGLYQMISSEPLISDVLGQKSYEVHGNKVTFTSDLTADLITAALVKLVVMDISAYTDFDPLPIPAEMEIDVITGTLEVLGIKVPENDKVDPISESKPVQQ